MTELAAPRGLTETFDLLSHPYRRYALYYLTNESETVHIDTVGTMIAEWKSSRTETGGSTDSKAVEIALRHTHLPKLADAGVISFGANRDFIELRETDGLDPFLDDTARIDGYVKTAVSD